MEERTPSEPEDVADVDSKELKTASKFDGIYSRVSSNRIENLRTTHIENRAKELVDNDEALQAKQGKEQIEMAAKQGASCRGPSQLFFAQISE